MNTLEQGQDTEDTEPTVTTTEIDEMDIDTLKADFCTIMATVVQTYGDDKE